jgi:energy-coupling factor transporter ATP-binding protein EcfA2
MGVVLENPYVQVSGMKRTVRDELAFPFECRGVSPGEMRIKISAIAEEFGISGLLDRSVEKLSGGELQRIIIAESLVTEPRFVFLDRPLTEIDTDFRPVLIRILGKYIQRDGGAALVAEDPWLLPQDDFDIRIALGDPKESTVDYSALRDMGDNRDIVTGGEILSVSSLSFSYDGITPVLNDVSLSLLSGEAVFMNGPNGAGKTTLARIITGILKPESGGIYIDGADAGSMPGWERMTAVGLALQNPGLHFSRATVREEFSLSGKWGTAPGDMIDVLGLDRYLDYHPLELTMAGRKRLGMALACGERRKVIILDEPSQYQDSGGFSMIVGGIRRLCADGKAVLIISHDPRFCEVFPKARTIRLSKSGNH